VKASTSAEVLDNWARIKVEEEGRKPKDSLMDEVSRGLPPVERAYKLQKKAAKVGFEFPNIAGVADKVREEMAEAEEALEKEPEELEGELGDLLFAVINYCRFLKVDPAVALQRTNNKFVSRFKHIEARMKETNTPMTKENLAIMDKYWDEAKSRQDA
jgi:tetrapyrrole methylase family protein/MazG family protein